MAWAGAAAPGWPEAWAGAREASVPWEGHFQCQASSTGRPRRGHSQCHTSSIGSALPPLRARMGSAATATANGAPGVGAITLCVSAWMRTCMANMQGTDRSRKWGTHKCSGQAGAARGDTGSNSSRCRSSVGPMWANKDTQGQPKGMAAQQQHTSMDTDYKGSPCPRCTVRLQQLPPPAATARRTVQEARAGTGKGSQRSCIRHKDRGPEKQWQAAGRTAMHRPGSWRTVRR